MGSLFLLDLADVARATGYPVVEVDGWEYRARGSGGYNAGKPDHVMVHHTASGPSSDGWPDVNYCTFSDDDAPLCNLYLSREGEIFVCAGGATNTNGSGDCVHLSPDTMNSSAVGIEAGNNGVGEAWPPTQQDAYIALCSALCSAYGIPTAHVESHAEYAPSRKTDPAGPSRWASSGTWAMDGFRHDIGHRPEPSPAPPVAEGEEDEDMTYIARNKDTGSLGLVSHGGAGVTFVWIMTGDDAAAYRSIGIETAEVSSAQFDMLAGQIRTVDIIGDTP